MPISIARKLQGFKALEFPGLQFQVRRVGLLPEHVREYGLPSTPLKVTEKRADGWEAAMGVRQTEVDALAALRPELLDTLVRQAIDPFFDHSLDRRVRDAKDIWLAEAQARLAEQLDENEIERIRSEAAEKLDQLQAEIDAINDALHIDIGDLDLPQIEIPEPEIEDAPHDDPLIDSEWSWAEQSMRLKADKAYE